MSETRWHRIRRWLLNHLVPRFIRDTLTADGSNMVADEFAEPPK